ncbi:hypothetical protein OsJ_10498 [Oryza sativa Japonica Group]|uniref:Uncharacterized protein n=1 Tax=Oryza sativa subsp. japonica TaxID=39947 RepID=A3AH09_ORYSJ|nr:hypothetical protein OsJ_10498 [Oryza sativa Japonica Group]
MPCIPASSPGIPHQHQHQHHRALAGVGMAVGCAAEAAVAAAGVAGTRCGAHDGEVPMEVARHHEHAEPGSGRCCSAVVQHVAAPAAAVWSVVRRFDQPQAYKRFVRSCALLAGDGGLGKVRERLEILDDESHVLSFRVVGGEHRLKNYLSVTTVHPSPSAPTAATVVVESYVVDVPPGNTPEDTRVFVDTIVKCNLQSLAKTAEKLAAGARAAGS